MKLVSKHCTLYHYPLCPFSRTVRLCLYEKNISYVLVFEKPWERRIDFLKLNPAGTVPVFEDEDGTILSDYRAICEYLNETRVGLEMLGAGEALTPSQKAAKEVLKIIKASTK